MLINLGYLARPKILMIMEYSRIVAVTGLPGLYEIVSSKSDGALVRSLDDKTTKFVSSRVHNLSHLESIEIYTTRDNVNLAAVFGAMKSNGAALPDIKDNKALKSYFETVYPDMDFERVYASDMKKMVKWFEVLENAGVDYTATSQEEEEGKAVTEEAPAAEATAEEKPKKAAAKKGAGKKAEPTAEAEGEEGGEEAPKKRTRKKKEEE